MRRAQPKILEGQQNQRAQHFFLFGLCLHETYNTNIDRWSCCPSFLTAKIKSSHEREIIKSDRKKHKQKILTYLGSFTNFQPKLVFFLANWQRKTRQLDALYVLCMNCFWSTQSSLNLLSKRLFHGLIIVQEFFAALNRCLSLL